MKFLGGGLQGIAAPPCLKEIIHDGNKISNFIHSLVQTSPKTYKKQNKTRQNKETKKQTKKNMVNFILIFVVEDTSLRDVFLWVRSLKQVQLYLSFSIDFFVFLLVIKSIWGVYSCIALFRESCLNWPSSCMSSKKVRTQRIVCIFFQHDKRLSTIASKMFWSKN